jgi:hypothetical protein
MNKIIFRIVVFMSMLILFLSISCADKTTSTNDNEQEKGLIPINISLAPLQDLEVTITEAVATTSPAN